MFTSTIDLKRLVSTEAEIVKALKDYVQVEEDRIIKIKQYIEVPFKIWISLSIFKPKYNFGYWSNMTITVVIK